MHIKNLLGILQCSAFFWNDAAWIDKHWNWLIIAVDPMHKSLFVHEALRAWQALHFTLMITFFPTYFQYISCSKSVFYEQSELYFPITNNASKFDKLTSTYLARHIFGNSQATIPVCVVQNAYTFMHAILIALFTLIMLQRFKIC